MHTDKKIAINWGYWTTLCTALLLFCINTLAVVLTSFFDLIRAHQVLSAFNNGFKFYLLVFKTLNLTSNGQSNDPIQPTTTFLLNYFRAIFI